MWLLRFEPRSPWPQRGILTTKQKQLDGFFTLKGVYSRIDMI